jgi:chemotaxis protein methyltransferase CheR
MNSPSKHEIRNNELRKFIETMKDLSGYDFSNYSDKSLKRRLSKVLLDSKLTVPILLEKISHNRDFLEQIVKDITVNTTELFRDPPVWNTLRQEILPLLYDKPEIMIWHAGCSTGQEVYSMLILLMEMDLFKKAKVYATDINSDVLLHASEGIYKYKFNVNYLDNFDKVIRQNRNGELIDVPYSKYFTIDKTRDLIRMHQFLLEKPIYKKMDLVTDPNPFSLTYDIIICRNVVIYFNYQLQNKVFKLFLDAMKPGGSLLLGVHETILGPVSSFFIKKNQVYYKK